MSKENGSIKQNWAKFESEKDMKKAYRLLSKLFHLHFSGMRIAIGFDPDKKLIWIRWNKPSEKIRLG